MRIKKLKNMHVLFCKHYFENYLKLYKKKYFQNTKFS